MSQERERECAKEGCQQPIYTGNAFTLDSPLGSVVVYVCLEHFAQWMQERLRLATEREDRSPRISRGGDVTSYTRGQWCTDLIKALGNTSPTQETLNFLLGWTIEESGHHLDAHLPAYNLLSTTRPMPGSTPFNQAGVQNYVNYVQGIAATVATLEKGLYPCILRALRENDSASLGIGTTMCNGVQGDLSVWVHGKRQPYATGYIATITRLANNPGTAASDVAPGEGPAS